MKTTLMIGDGFKQITFAPENKHDKMILSLLTSDQDISLLVRQGSIFDINSNESAPFAENIAQCTGGWFRSFADSGCRSIIIQDKIVPDDNSS